MHACIHASTPKMHQNILIVLEGLHSQKKVRLQGPRGGRGLGVAHLNGGNCVGHKQALKMLVLFLWPRNIEGLSEFTSFNRVTQEHQYLHFVW